MMSCARAEAQVRCPVDARANDLATRFVITGGDIEMPIGAFLLIRKGNQLGAIRLVAISPTSTEWLGQATYESYFQVGGARSPLAANTAHHIGELELRQSKGPGRGIYIYKPGPYRAQIGEWLFGFDGPSKMVMTNHSVMKGDYSDHGFEFAPTSACSLSELNAQEKGLKWFRYDRNASVVLPLADLPK